MTRHIRWKWLSVLTLIFQSYLFDQQSPPLTWVSKTIDHSWSNPYEYILYVLILHAKLQKYCKYIMTPPELFMPFHVMNLKFCAIASDLLCPLISFWPIPAFWTCLLYQICLMTLSQCDYQNLYVPSLLYCYLQSFNFKMNERVKWNQAEQNLSKFQNLVIELCPH